MQRELNCQRQCFCVLARMKNKQFTQLFHELRRFVTAVVFAGRVRNFLVGLFVITAFHADAREVGAVRVETYTLAKTNLFGLGNPACDEAALKLAARNGLKFTDLPSVGSGLAKAGENEFWGITDR